MKKVKNIKQVLSVLALFAAALASKAQSPQYTPVVIDSLPFDILIGNNKAGSINPKTANTFLGFCAAWVNTTGNHCTGIGSGALFSNTTGTHNTALGVSTLRFSTTGSRNTAIGMGVMRYNSTGYRNTGTGNDALRYNTTGYENTADGAFALDSNTTGYNNTAIGAYALRYNTTGVNNTALGHNAFSQMSPAFSNSTAIGANTVITAGNQVRIGDANVTSIIGQVNFSAVSDGRFKKDVSSGNVPGLDFILMLNPVMYRYDMDKIAAFLHTPDNIRQKEVEARKGSILHTGFIGQQVEKAATELGYDFSGIDKPESKSDYYGLRYAEFVVPLVKAVQEQQQMIEQLKSEILQLKSDLNKMKNR
ncbi:MAG: tail fiber domain-containing protein [Chitinophagaceae bacterium]|nr:tail fiber domain-containing protein [Chitinophagaceae bacterium]